MRRKSTTSEMMRTYIVDALLLLMEKQDFSDITVDEIVAKAGVNRSTYYRHFNSKEAVIIYFLDHVMGGYLEWAKGRELDLQQYLLNLFRYFMKYRKQLLTIYRAGLSVLFLQVLEKYFYQSVGQDQPLMEQHMLAFYIGGIFNHFRFWFSRDMQDSPEMITSYVLNVLPSRFYPYLLRE